MWFWPTGKGAPVACAEIEHDQVWSAFSYLPEYQARRHLCIQPLYPFVRQTLENELPMLQESSCHIWNHLLCYNLPLNMKDCAWHNSVQCSANVVLTCAWKDRLLPDRSVISLSRNGLDNGAVRNTIIRARGYRFGSFRHNESEQLKKLALFFIFINFCLAALLNFAVTSRVNNVGHHMNYRISPSE